MKKMWNKKGEGELPAGHWLHKAMAKEKMRHAKKSSAPKKMVVEEINETYSDNEKGEM